MSDVAHVQSVPSATWTRSVVLPRLWMIHTCGEVRDVTFLRGGVVQVRDPQYWRFVYAGNRRWEGTWTSPFPPLELLNDEEGESG